MITIDGSRGEGGGQILRTALALSVATGRPFRLENIRAGRSRPGLRPQHVACVRAAAAVGDAELEGAEKGSSALAFSPRGVRPGDHVFDVGTAGSATLVAQAVLPPLLLARAPSRLTVSGGTHNPAAPPYEFLARTWLPLIARLGPRVEARLERHGFAPAGGGRLTLSVEPVPTLGRLELLERGRILDRRAWAYVADLPLHIAARELGVVGRRLGWRRREQHAESLTKAKGPGNVLLLELESEHVTETFAGFGQPGVRAETVANRAVMDVFAYLDADVPVGEHLADQLLLPLSLGGGGAFRTLPLSSHAETQIAMLRLFLDADVEVRPSRPRSVKVVVEGVSLRVPEA